MALSFKHLHQHEHHNSMPASSLSHAQTRVCCCINNETPSMLHVSCQLVTECVGWVALPASLPMHTHIRKLHVQKLLL